MIWRMQNNEHCMLRVDSFIIQYLYSWGGKLEMNHGMLQVRSDLEMSSGPERDPAWDYGAPCPNAVRVVFIERCFFLTLG